MTGTIPGQRLPFDAMQRLAATLDPETRKAILADWLVFLDSSQKATEASEAWVKRNAYLKDYCKANRYSEQGTRDKLSKDWALNDAMDAWSWHTREANRRKESIELRILMASVGLIK